MPEWNCNMPENAFDFTKRLKKIALGEVFPTEWFTEWVGGWFGESSG